MLDERKDFLKAAEAFQRRGALTEEEARELEAQYMALTPEEAEWIRESGRDYPARSFEDLTAPIREQRVLPALLAVNLLADLRNLYNNEGWSEHMLRSTACELAGELRRGKAQYGCLGICEPWKLDGWFSLERFCLGSLCVGVTTRNGAPALLAYPSVTGEKRRYYADLRRGIALFADRFGDTVPVTATAPLTASFQPQPDGTYFAELPKETAPCTLLRQNPDLRDLLIAARRPDVRSLKGPTAEHPPLLTLLHCADPHNAEKPMAQIGEAIPELADLCEDVICTGDMVLGWHGAGMDYWQRIPNHEQIMVCMGNHDMLNNPQYDWTDLIPQETAYRDYFEQDSVHWNAELLPGKTYFCKHYDPQRVTLIAMNSMLEGAEDEAQVAYLRERLEEARQKGYSVVIAIHDAPKGERELLSCNFTALDRMPGNACGHGCTETYQQTVQDFMDAGGNFFCWLAGHVHCDYICRDPKFPAQWFLLIAAPGALRGDLADLSRRDGEKSANAMNFVTFDPERKTLRLVRAGADRDAYLRSRKTLTFRYDTGEIISQS